MMYLMNHQHLMYQRYLLYLLYLKYQMFHLNLQFLMTRSVA